MKLTKQKLMQIIKEELEIISEANFDTQTGEPLTQKGWEIVSKMPDNPYYKQAQQKLAGGGGSDERYKQEQKQKAIIVKKFTLISREFQSAMAELKNFGDAAARLHFEAEAIGEKLGELPFKINKTLLRGAGYNKE